MSNQRSDASRALEAQQTIHFSSQLQLWKQRFEASRCRVVVTKSAVWGLQSSGSSTVYFSLQLQSWKQWFEASRALEAQQSISIHNCNCQISDLRPPQLWKLNRPFLFTIAIMKATIRSLQIQSCSYQISDLRPPKLWRLNSHFFFTVAIMKATIWSAQSLGSSTAHFYSEL